MTKVWVHLKDNNSHISMDNVVGTMIDDGVFVVESENEEGKIVSRCFVPLNEMRYAEQEFLDEEDEKKEEPQEEQ